MAYGNLWLRDLLNEQSWLDETRSRNDVRTGCGWFSKLFYIENSRVGRAYPSHSVFRFVRACCFDHVGFRGAEWGFAPWIFTVRLDALLLNG